MCVQRNLSDLFLIVSFLFLFFVFPSRNVSKVAGRLTNCCTKKQVSHSEQPLRQVFGLMKGLAEVLIEEREWSGVERLGVAWHGV